MCKFNAGDTVQVKAGVISLFLECGVEYTVDQVLQHQLIVEGIDHKYDSTIFELVHTKETPVHKFKVGDTVRRTTKWAHGNVVQGGEYKVSHVRADGALQLEGNTRYHYNDAYFELVVLDGDLTDKEVFNAIVDGKPLQYRIGGTDWFNLKYPEKLTLLDVQRGTYRVRPTEVKLDCTVPYPEFTQGTVQSNGVRKFSVDLATGRIRDFGAGELPQGGVFWSTKEQAEQFRDAVLASLQGN